ncbi:hypothetical protein KVR01_004166 [Diaporthe batatas]|uniref:uncharacterized protein n=1 Tax=Diaporthe batatas TaxID=748121 RepID=UPI001D0395AE|nr:uncharacterized protein KVR01_004166 [Diaporthe batatas]KAG8165614.1 hypothetical protein KVR01_004166 [Diaporthe batatas]
MGDEAQLRFICARCPGRRMSNLARLAAGNGWLQPTRGDSNTLKRNGGQPVKPVWPVSTPRLDRFVWMSLHSSISKWGKERLPLGEDGLAPTCCATILPTLSPVQSSRTASPHLDSHLAVAATPVGDDPLCSTIMAQFARIC